MSAPIRPAREGDLDSLAALDAATNAQAWSRASWASELAHPDALVLVYEAGDVLIGFASARRCGPEAELLLIAVRSEGRRRGVASSLLSALKDRLVVSGTQTLHLEVRARNAGAIALYLRSGFAETGRRRGYYRVDPDDAVLMTCDLAREPRA